MLFALMREMRINQWTKNILVYAALLFGGGLFHEGQFILATQMFSSFCLVSSGVYFINDIFDVEKDRVNCRKKKSPNSIWGNFCYYSMEFCNRFI